MDHLEKFRTAATRQNKNRPRAGRRYPDELRRLAVEHYRARREAGVARYEIAAELGVSSLTLKRWLEAVPTFGVLRPVRIIETVETSNLLTLVTPGGLRIEGVSWEQALDAARAFS